MAEDATIRLGYDNAKVRSGAAQTVQIMESTASKVQSKVAAINGAGRSVGGAGMRNAGGVAMQVQDIAVQLQGGTNAMVVFAQQGSQLASMFGPTGMLIGGLAAIGGLAYTVGQRGKEAFEGMIKGADDLHAQTAILMGTGGLADIISATEKITANAEAMNAELAKGATFTGAASALLGGDLPQDRMNELAKKASQAEFDRQKLALRSLEVAQQEADIAEMRAAGRSEEADEIERQLELKQKLARIDQMPFAEKTKAGLKDSATRVSDAEAAGEKRMQDQRAAKDEDRKRASRESLAADLAAMEARSRGQEKLAKQIEKEQGIKARSAQIAQQLGISATDARGIAEKEIAMQDSIDKSGGRRRIQGGVSRDSFTGLEGTTFSGLDSFKRLQAGGRGERRNAAFGDGDPLDWMLQSRRGLEPGAKVTRPGSSTAHGGTKGNDEGKAATDLLARIDRSLEKMSASFEGLDD